jgi:hypothetical protein
MLKDVKIIEMQKQIIYTYLQNVYRKMAKSIQIKETPISEGLSVLRNFSPFSNFYPLRHVVFLFYP